MIILEEAISAFPQFAWNTDIPGSDMCRVVTRGMGSIMVISKRAIADFPGEVRNGLSHRRTEAAALGMGEVLAAAFPPSRWQDLLIRRSLVLVAAYAAVVLLGIGYYRQGGNRRKLFACAGILAAGFAVVAGVIGLMSHQERWGLLTVIRGKCGEKSFHVLHGIVMSSSGVGDPVYVDHTDNAPLPVFSRDAPESPDRLWGGWPTVGTVCPGISAGGLAFGRRWHEGDRFPPNGRGRRSCSSERDRLEFRGGGCCVGGEADSGR